MRNWKNTARVAILFWGLGLPRAFAEDTVPASSRALLLLRALAFDRKLPAKLGENVVVAIGYRKGNSSSESCQKEMSTALEAAAAKSTVAGKPVKAASVPYSAGSFQSDLEAAKAVSLYLCPGLEDELPSIVKLTRSRSLLTFTGQESYVDAGVSIGFVLRGTKAAIVVNLPAAKAEGADLDAALLTRSEVRK